MHLKQLQSFLMQSDAIPINVNADNDNDNAFDGEIVVDDYSDLIFSSTDALSAIKDHSDVEYEQLDDANNNNDANDDEFIHDVYHSSSSNKSLFVQNLLNLKSKVTLSSTLINHICTLIRSSFPDIPKVQQDVPQNYYQLDKLINKDKPIVKKVINKTFT